MKRCLILLLTITVLLSGCTAATAVPTAASTSPVATDTPTQTNPHTLTVFAAASLTDAFEEISAAFETAHPGVTVTCSFAGSQTLRTQLEEGAQADVFASANTKEMDALVTGGFVAGDGSQIFLTNQLVVILPADNPAGLVELADLGKDELKIVLANAEVPAGKYTLQVLDMLDAALGTGFKDRVMANVVSYENDVKSVVAKVKLGEADAGIVYLSDTVAAPELKKIEIPAENNVVAKYPIAALTQTKEPDLSQAFIEFVLSSEGQAILEKWGFVPIE